MNSEFEWRRGLRGLNEPVQPALDLWPGIQAQLRRPRRRSRQAGLALAASLMIACTAYLFVSRFMPANTGHPVQKRTAAVHKPADDALPQAALDWAVPANPTLATAAHELDHASVQLQQALEQRPDAVFLVSLINRTNAQRMRLLREPAAG